MTIRKIFMAGLMLLALSVAHGVEKRDALPLWFEGPESNFGWIEHFNSLDFYPATTGTELIGFNETISAETAGGLSRMVWQQRIEIRNAQNGARLLLKTITTKSDWYSNDDSTYDYFCGDEFAAQLNLDNSIPDCDAVVSAGIAETQGGGRYLVIATGSIIDYWDGIGDEVADVYKVHVFDLATGNLAWANSWFLFSPGGSNGEWELDVNLSGVSDYINGDGTDEVRIAQGREQGGNWRSRYQYFDITNGNLIDTVAFSTSAP